ncbi:hypothetical protein EDD86DRAFT_75148 [Gorgonomyces haynaldii]|nr:hypothetical protein EDD86DRAFT_75148 [Gorgonomyces haynaldii]
MTQETATVCLECSGNNCKTCIDVTKVSSSCNLGGVPRMGEPINSFQMHLAVKRWSKAIGEQQWQVLPLLVSHTSRLPQEIQLYHMILSRKLPVNQYHRSQSKHCSYCPEDESIEHFLFECPKSQQFWLKAVDLLREMLSMSAMEIPKISPADIVVCFPDLLPRLALEEQHQVIVFHSVALMALWQARSNSDGQHLWQRFVFQLKQRLNPEESHDSNRWSDSSACSPVDSAHFSFSDIGSPKSVFDDLLGCYDLELPQFVNH